MRENKNMSVPKVSIIILHFKNISCLTECLASIDKITYLNFEVIVVNNGLHTINGIDKDLNLKVKIIENNLNLGFAKGNNIGIKEALKNNSEYVFLLNDDTVVSPDFLEVLVNEGEKDLEAGMLGPKICYFDEPQTIWFAGSKFDEQNCLLSFPNADEEEENLPNEKSFESDYITGCAILVKKSVIEKIGLLDEKYFLYWEDVDWSFRARKAGFKNILVPISKILHKVSVSMGGNDSPLKAYYKTRNHLFFAQDYAPKAKMQLLKKNIRDIIWLLFKSSDTYRMKKAFALIIAIFDYYRGKKGSASKWVCE
jgi:GT2 family glycosyltransferase